MPWANGGGTTHEVIVAPHDAGLADLDWRISLAEIDADGPFSRLPGIDRILVVTEGEGVDLTIDGRTVSLTRLQPITFTGESTTLCALTAGPTRDLNVMTRRGVCTATLDLVALDAGEAGDGDYALPPDVSAMVVIDGECDLPAAGVLGLRPRDAVLTPAPGRVTGTATVALVTVRYDATTQ
jgi:environmental stress-induced protein Ves